MPGRQGPRGFWPLLCGLLGALLFCTPAVASSSQSAYPSALAHTFLKEACPQQRLLWITLDKEQWPLMKRCLSKEPRELFVFVRDADLLQAYQQSIAQAEKRAEKRAASAPHPKAPMPWNRLHVKVLDPDYQALAPYPHYFQALWIDSRLFAQYSNPKDAALLKDILRSLAPQARIYSAVPSKDKHTAAELSAFIHHYLDAKLLLLEEKGGANTETGPVLSFIAEK